MYKVIKSFRDLEDGRYLYKDGDIYPRKGVEPSEERIAELAGTKNKLKTPLIKKVNSRRKKKDKEN